MCCCSSAAQQTSRPTAGWTGGRVVPISRSGRGFRLLQGFLHLTGSDWEPRQKWPNCAPQGKQCVQGEHEEPPRCQWQQVPLAGEDDWCRRCRPRAQLCVILCLLALLIPALSQRVISKATCIKIFQIISALLNISLSPLVPWFYK